MMKTISRDAGLHNIYTNHCIRVSLVTWLKENDIPNDQIKAVTNQKSNASIERYNKRLTSCKKRKISETITQQLRGPSTSTETNQVQINQIFVSNDESQIKEKPTLVLEKNGTKCFVYL